MLTDRHMFGHLISRQFPEMPPPQSTLYAQNLKKLKPVSENSFFFHRYSAHWALSCLREGKVYLYDSLQPTDLHPD